MSVTAPEGFLASGIHCGIKSAGELDLALVLAEGSVEGSAADSAAVFTSNKLLAAPVTLSQSHLEKSGQKTRAIILNSGCANAATGLRGEQDALQTCETLAEKLGTTPEQILVCSTGLIGYPLPIKEVVGGVPDLVTALSKDGGKTAAEAIMTTDTSPKEHIESVEDGEGGFMVGGMAKGAAMLAPNMATMLAVITTDATCENPGEELPQILKRAVDDSFNRLSVDGVQSTNDTVILLSSGKAGKKSIAQIEAGVTKTCQALAEMMVADAEGGTKTVKVHISGAPDIQTADFAARYLADSMLIKCSWHGGDPYWGRLASELGAAGIEVNLDKLTLSYGDFKVFAGEGTVSVDEVGIKEYMSGKHLDVFVDLGMGDGSSYILTCDLGHGYIDENSKTS